MLVMKITRRECNIERPLGVCAFKSDNYLEYLMRIVLWTRHLKGPYERCRPFCRSFRCLMGKEILTLQLGHKANYLATHFWNSQVLLFQNVPD